MQALRRLIEARASPWTEAEMGEHFLATPQSFALAIDRLEAEDAITFRFLDEALTCHLLAESEKLTYRPATPAIGPEERRVFQDFELTMSFQPDDPFSRFARALDRLCAAALERLDQNPCPGMTHNDLILQRYQPGSGGITPHRDHIRYRGLVSLFVLAGEGDFYVCKDREGTDAKRLPSPPGSLVLMRGAGFAGMKDRPFHMLKDIRSFRVSFGLRWDTRPEEPL